MRRISVPTRPDRKRQHADAINVDSRDRRIQRTLEEEVPGRRSSAEVVQRVANAPGASIPASSPLMSRNVLIGIVENVRRPGVVLEK